MRAVDCSRAILRLVMASRSFGRAALLAQPRATPWADDVGRDEACEAWASRTATAVWLGNRVVQCRRQLHGRRRCDPSDLALKEIRG
jgi:hypothetical protein